MDVIIKVNPFAIYQSVFIKTPTKIETDQIELNKLTTFLSSLPGDAVVQMVGNKKYLEKIVEEYKEKEKTEYDQRHLNIIIHGTEKK